MAATCKITLENRAEEFQRFESAFLDFARLQRLTDDVIYAIQLSIDELFLNIVSYGYDDDDKHLVEVIIKSTDDEITVELIDDAKAFNPLDDAPEPDLDVGLEDRRIGGVGIHLVKTMMTDVSYKREDNMNHLYLKKKLEH